MSAISLMSAPAAKTFSPPYTTTALTSSRSVASAAAARISSWTWTLSAFIFGRSSRIVPTPSATSSRTNSPMSIVSLSSRSSPDPSDHNGASDSRELALAHPRRERSTCGPAGTRTSARRGGRRPRTSPCSPPRRPPSGCASSTRRTCETRHQLTEHTLGVWNGADPRRPGRPALRLPRRRAVAPAPRAGASTPHKLLLDPYARAVTGELGPGPALLAYDVADGSAQHVRLRAVDAAQRRRPRRVRLGRRPPDAAPLARHRDLRAARQGLHRSCTTRSPSTCAARTPGSATRTVTTTCATSG